MLEKIIELDKKAFVFLNGLGSNSFDGFWLLITNQFTWIPLYLLVFYLIQKKIGWKNFGYYLLFTAFLILICDQTANLFKNHFQRLRPCNDEELKSIIRIVKTSPAYSFFSGHSVNSMATTVFAFSILRKHYRYSFFLFLFPLIFAFSRIYLGLHFPGDVLTGYFFGVLYGGIISFAFRKYILDK
ncbi:phosphatase PAP2 family protein [Flavobacterium sp.]|uniref:phosphatase PAP2 family protein n=1 Tax=Flavobacterium sp. TaxID=239 RepID=UPI0035AFAA29